MKKVIDLKEYIKNNENKPTQEAIQEMSFFFNGLLDELQNQINELCKSVQNDIDNSVEFFNQYREIEEYIHSLKNLYGNTEYTLHINIGDKIKHK